MLCLLGKDESVSQLVAYCMHSNALFFSKSLIRVVEIVNYVVNCVSRLKILASFIISFRVVIIYFTVCFIIPIV